MIWHLKQNISYSTSVLHNSICFLAWFSQACIIHEWKWSTLFFHLLPAAVCWQYLCDTCEERIQKTMWLNCSNIPGNVDIINAWQTNSSSPGTDADPDFEDWLFSTWTEDKCMSSIHVQVLNWAQSTVLDSWLVLSAVLSCCFFRIPSNRRHYYARQVWVSCW